MLFAVGEASLATHMKTREILKAATRAGGRCKGQYDLEESR
jgi:hypothetical protein